MSALTPNFPWWRNRWLRWGFSFVFILPINFFLSLFQISFVAQWVTLLPSANIVWLGANIAGFCWFDSLSTNGDAIVLSFLRQGLETSLLFPSLWKPFWLERLNRGISYVRENGNGFLVRLVLRIWSGQFWTVVSVVFIRDQEVIDMFLFVVILRLRRRSGLTEHLGWVNLVFSGARVLNIHAIGTGKVFKKLIMLLGSHPFEKIMLPDGLSRDQPRVSSRPTWREVLNVHVKIDKLVFYSSCVNLLLYGW